MRLVIKFVCMNKRFQILSLLLLTLMSFLLTGCAADSNSIESLASRVIGEAAENFVFDIIPPAEGGKDVFEIVSDGDCIRISGNNGVSQASGLNYYLENFCGVQVSVNRRVAFRRRENKKGD